MDILRRDELFEMIRKNREKYMQLCEEFIEVDEDYQSNFPEKDSKDVKLKYNKVYKDKQKALYENNKILNAEWEKLRTELNDFVKA